MQETDTLTEESLTNTHTEDMQEIITKVPSWILRWGIMVFFGILLMVVAISIFVRYPDTIKAGLKIQSASTSAPVGSKVEGRMTKLFAKQGATVKDGQPLAEVETLTAPNEIFTLNAPQTGKVDFVSIVQPGIFLRPGQVVFTVHPENEQFFGVTEVPLTGINKIKIGQPVLITLRNFPADEYGQLTGAISYIADEPDRRGLFTIKVTFNNSQLKQPIVLKDWMTGDAEIITQDVSVLKRVSSNLFKFIK